MIDARPPTAPPWRALEERVAALENEFKLIREELDDEVLTAIATHKQQRAVNEALLAAFDVPESDRAVRPITAALCDVLREALK